MWCWKICGVGRIGISLRWIEGCEGGFLSWTTDLFGVTSGDVVIICPKCKYTHIIYVIYLSEIQEIILWIYICTNFFHTQIAFSWRFFNCKPCLNISPPQFPMHQNHPPKVLFGQMTSQRSHHRLQVHLSIFKNTRDRLCNILTRPTQLYGMVIKSKYLSDLTTCFVFIIPTSELWSFQMAMRLIKHIDGQTFWTKMPLTNHNPPNLVHQQHDTIERSGT